MFKVWFCFTGLNIELIMKTLKESTLNISILLYELNRKITILECTYTYMLQPCSFPTWEVENWVWIMEKVRRNWFYRTISPKSFMSFLPASNLFYKIKFSKLKSKQNLRFFFPPFFKQLSKYLFFHFLKSILSFTIFCSINQE